MRLIRSLSYSHVSMKCFNNSHDPRLKYISMKKYTNQHDTNLEQLTETLIDKRRFIINGLIEETNFRFFFFFSFF